MNSTKLRCRTRRSRKLLFVSAERQRKFILLGTGQCKWKIWSLGDHPSFPKLKHPHGPQPYMINAVLTLGRTRNSYPHRATRGVAGGEGGWWNPYLQFLICCSISKRFCLQWKAFALLNKIRYILLVVALLEACDGINNRRHFGRHFLFIQVKTSINDHFLFLTCKIIHK